MLRRGGGGGHSPEAEQLTWDVKVTTGSAEGRMLEYATRMSAAHLTAGKRLQPGGAESSGEADYRMKSGADER